MDFKRARFPIRLKLMCVIGTLVLAIVGFLGIYFPAHQLAALSDALRTRSETYARLASKQLRSAVAFDDKETAREVLDSLAEDGEVAGISFFGDGGDLIYGTGKLPDVSALTRRAKKGSLSEDLELLVISAAPVVSLEGPRGVVVIALSKRSLAERTQAVRQTALSVGLVTFLLGLIAAWRIARALSRRLGAIADTAGRVAAGNLELEVPADDSSDEIGAVSRAFSAMVAQLRELFARIKAAANEEQARLEHLVAQRTRDLDTRNRDMRLVLDNVGQGFATISPAGTLSRERSAILERWFGPPPADGDFFNYLTQGDEERARWFRCCFDAVFEDILPAEVALDQIPKEVRHGELIFALEFRAIYSPAGILENILVVVSDVTAQRARAHAEIEERETQRLISRLLSDRAGFYEFLSEARELVTEIRLLREGPQVLRDVHTLKGISALYGLETLVRLCHELESRYLEGERESVRASAEKIVARWSELEKRLKPLLASSDTSRMEIDLETHRELIEAVESGRPREEILQLLRSLSHEPVKVRLARIAEQAKALAERLDKGPIEVLVKADRTRLDPREWSGFWSVLSHVVRNAVDHGLESSEERKTLGKKGPASLVLTTSMRADDLVVEVADSGRGIDWMRLRSKAVDLGLPSESTIDLVNAMFTDGISTKTEATEISGRGLGLAAVRAECQQRGGRIEVNSIPGQGTSFIFRWPAKVAAVARAG